MKLSIGVSLNDTLLVGPNLYPLLSDILHQFRRHSIGFSSDISKMLREILLHDDERDLLRFLLRNFSGDICDYRMRQLMFGVKSSPFLATRRIQHPAETHRSSHPRASQTIVHDFYVDDFISRALSVEEADQLHQELISNHSIPRRLTTNSSPVIFQALHGFSDASTVTYGAAVYLRTIHQDTSVSTMLITSKARVVPLKSTTISRLDLVAAYLLAKLLRYITKLFDIPRGQIFGWTNSKIVLCWLRKAPSSLKTFVSHRVATIQDIIHANH